MSDELRWLVDHKEEIIHKLNLKNDTLLKRLEIAIDEIKAIRNRAVISPSKTDYELIRMVDYALTKIEEVKDGQ